MEAVAKVTEAFSLPPAPDGYEWGWLCDEPVLRSYGPPHRNIATVGWLNIRAHLVTRNVTAYAYLVDNADVCLLGEFPDTYKAGEYLIVIAVLKE